VQNTEQQLNNFLAQGPLLSVVHGIRSFGLGIGAATAPRTPWPWIDVRVGYGKLAAC
jgi:hypothetical protein